MKTKNPVDSRGRPVRIRTKNNRGVIIFRLGKKVKGEMRFSENWTYRKCWNKRQFYFPLGSDRRKAEQLANAIDAFLRAPGATMEAAIAKYNPKKLEKVFPERQQGLATVGELLEAHKRVERMLELSPQTAHAYRSRLVSTVRRVMAFRKKQPFGRSSLHWEKQTEALAQCTSIFDGQFIQDLKLSFLKEATNLEEERRKKGTANSAIADIRSLFTEEACGLYRLKLPDFSSFMEEKTWRRVGSSRYRLPSFEVILAIGDRAVDLKKNDRNAYLAYLLALHAGLRAKEISHARPEWLEEGVPPRIWVTEGEDFGTKGHDSRPVELEPWVYEEIISLVEGPGYLITGSNHERGRRVFDRLNAHLRGLGVEVQKPTHELRKLFGSFIASTLGIFVAQKFLGHKTPQITSDTYADALLDEKLQGIWKGEGGRGKAGKGMRNGGL